MDAFVIRGMLVPAIMKLAGDANWWAPSVHAQGGTPPRPGRTVAPASPNCSRSTTLSTYASAMTGN